MTIRLTLGYMQQRTQVMQEDIWEILTMTVQQTKQIRQQYTAMNFFQISIRVH